MNIKFSMVLAMATVAATMASTAIASESCLGPGGTGISDVTTITAAGGCTVSGSSLLFDNFTVVASGGAAGPIGLEPIATGVVGDDVDLAFGFPQVRIPPGTGSLMLSYSVVGGIDGVDVAFTATPITTGGSVSVTEKVCTVAFTAGNCVGGTQLANYSATSTGQYATGSATFATTGAVWIYKDIVFNNATTSDLTNSQQIGVPEPMTFSLLGAGLLGLGLMGRKRRQ